MAWRWTRLSEGSSTPHTPSSRSRSGFEDAAPRVDRGLRAVLELDLAGALGLVAEVRRRAPGLRGVTVQCSAPSQSFGRGRRAGHEPSGSLGSFGPTDLAQLKPGIIMIFIDLRGAGMRSARSAYLSKAARPPWTPSARVLSPMVLTYTLDLRGVGRGRRRRVSQSAPIEVHDLLRSVIVDLHIRIHSRGLRWANGRGGSHGCTAVTWQ